MSNLKIGSLEILTKNLNGLDYLDDLASMLSVFSTINYLEEENFKKITKKDTL